MSRRQLRVPLVHENLADKQATQQWNSIDWKAAEQFVTRIQIRITKAMLAKNYNLVKRLQYLLVHSFYAKALSVKRVTENKGKRTPGVDGITWNTPAQKMNAIFMLGQRNYKSKPLRRVYIEKYGKKEKRPLSIPTMFDRAMQALYLQALSPISEATADLTSFGFRTFRSTHDAMSHIFNLLAKKSAGTWILEGDIKGCFDNIQHRWLMENIPMDKRALNEFLKAGYVFDKTLFPTDSGTPQGGTISPTLANMTLDGMEQAIALRYWINSRGKVDKKHLNHKKINFIRFADDFIVTATDKETLVEIQRILEDFLAQRGLTLSKEKTLITPLSAGFDFLGWNFIKRKEKLIIAPSKKSLNKIIESLRQVIQSNKAVEQKVLIQKLNQRLIGWSNYHRAVCAKQTFKKLNHILWNMLWTWCKRRHPKKGNRWVVKKYWKTIESRNWVFMQDQIRLIDPADIPIVRHIALKLDKNPFLDRQYFEMRKNSQRRKNAAAYRRTKAAYLFGR